jgi:hypothetical protein
MANNRATAMQFLLGKGLTRQQAAGVVGSLMQESGLRPGAKNPSSGALGIGQWLGGRKTNLLARGATGLRPQLDFLWSELQGPENAALKRLKGAHSVADAVNAFTWGFERPGRAEANIPNRVNQARAALGLGTGGGGGSTPVMPNPDNRRLTSDAGAQAQTAQITLPERPKLQITAPTAPAFAARASTSQAPTSQPGAPQIPAYNAPARFEAGKALEALTALSQGGSSAATTSGDQVAPASGGGKYKTSGAKGSKVLELIYNDGGKGYGIKNGQVVDAPRSTPACGPGTQPRPRRRRASDGGRAGQARAADGPARRREPALRRRRPGPRPRLLPLQGRGDRRQRRRRSDEPLRQGGRALQPHALVMATTAGCRS